MIIISYDIADDKKRTAFSKYLKRFGHRIQYSVFEIDNSRRILDNILKDIEGKFEKQFGEEDSIYIFDLSASCKIKKYGYAKNEDKDLLICL